MQDNTISKYLNLMAIPTTTAAMLFYMGAANLPEHNIYSDPIRGGNIMGTLGKRTITNITLEDNDQSYHFINDSEKIIEQVSIIHDFVSLLLQESQDLDPKYSKVVDKYFWDLA